jgi:hypothetical protein
MAYKFDMEKSMKEYDEAHIKQVALFNDLMHKHPTGAINDVIKTMEPIKPADYRKNIEKTISDIKSKTACLSCPRFKKCNRINWKQDITFLEVTGCDLHPDQKKFKGHSTTVVITDSTVSASSQNNNLGSWANCRSAASASEGVFTNTLANYIYKDATPTYVIVRGHLYMDTTLIPPTAIVSGAFYSIYCDVVYNSNGNADDMNIVKGNTAPHNPVVVADYNNTKYDYLTNSASVARATLNPTAYNNFTISDLAIIVVNGYTLGMMVYSDDQDNNMPSVALSVYGATFQGSAAAHPPKLSVTYDLPAPPVPTSNPGWSGTGQRASWEGLSLPARITVAPRHQRI